MKNNYNGKNKKQKVGINKEWIKLLKKWIKLHINQKLIKKKINIWLNKMGIFWKECNNRNIK